MATEIATPTNPMREFQAKIETKVREDIADLLPAEAVAELVKKAVDDVFFKTRIEMTGHWNDKRVEKPSWFVEAVAKEAKPILEAAVKEFIAANEAVVQKAVDDYLTPQNLTVLAVGSLSSDISMAINNLAMSVRDRNI